jgi:hypothetical protein
MLQPEVPRHPFAIMAALPKAFGYTLAFLNGALKWDFDATSGGGRQSLEAVKDLVNELARSTMAGADLESRKLTLKSLFLGHYDQRRILFLLQFLLPEITFSPSITKDKAAELLADNHAPFIPFSILQLHLTKGVKAYEKSKTFKQVDWSMCYDDFLEIAPFGSKKSVVSEEEKSRKLTAAITYWEDAFTTINKTVPKDKHQGLSDADVDKLTGSQFSVSVGGTPTIKDSFVRTAEERALREKLTKATAQYKELVAINLKKKEVEDLTNQLMEDVSLPSKKKRKQRAVASDSDDDADTGTHALDRFLRSFKNLVERALYIDFSRVSANRLKAIKMLNASSIKTTTIAVGLTFKSAMSDADVAYLENDLLEITSGFHHHYIKVVSESQLDNPMAIMTDRLEWWQWTATTFFGNPAAQVLFIKDFVFDNHAAPFWFPLVKQESILVARCFHLCPDSKVTALIKNPKSPPVVIPMVKTGKLMKKKSAPTGGHQNQQSPKLSPAQEQKLLTWKRQHPGCCLSRIVRGRVCYMESKSQTCRFEHKCAWCGSPSCKAECAQAPTL